LDARTPTGRNPAGGDVGNSTAPRAELQPPLPHWPDEGLDTAALSDDPRPTAPNPAGGDRQLTACATPAAIIYAVPRKKSKPQCISCGREQVSDEHVFGRWVSRLFADGAPFTLTKAPGRSTPGLKVINVKNRATCSGCNGGWMSRSESEAKALLPPVIRGEAIRWDSAQQTRVARWAFKTGLMLDRSSVASQVAPRQHFRFLFKQQCPPESVTIYLARYFPGADEDHVAVIGSSCRPTGVNPYLYPDPYQITFSVGQIVFQVVGHSGTAPVEIRRIGRLHSGLVIPTNDQFQRLWPIRTEHLAWPPTGAHLNTPSLQALARF